MRYLFVFIITSLLSSPIYGQGISVSDYIRQVYNYSLDVKSSKQNVEAAYHAAKLAQTSFLPRLDAAANGSYGFRDYSVPGFNLETYSITSGLTLSQNIYSGSSVKNTVESARIGKEIAQFSEIYTSENIVVVASNLYWHAAATMNYVEAATKYVNIIKDNYALLEIRFNDGISAKTDLLMMQTRLKQAEYDLTRANKAMQQAMVAVNILRGEDVKTPIEFSGVLDVTDATLAPLKSISDIIDTKSEYKIAALSVENSIAQMKINRAQFLPKISVGANATYGTRMINIDGSLVTDGSVFLKFSTPIFAWGQKRKRANIDATVIKKADYQLQQTEDNIITEVNDSYLSLSESFEQLELTSSSLDIAQESLDLNTFSYDEGMISVIELLSSQLSWISAYNNKIGANLAYRTSLVKYQKAIGELQITDIVTQ